MAHRRSNLREEESAGIGNNLKDVGYVNVNSQDDDDNGRGARSSVRWSLRLQREGPLVRVIDMAQVDRYALEVYSGYFQQKIKPTHTSENYLSRKAKNRRAQAYLICLSYIFI